MNKTLSYIFFFYHSEYHENVLWEFGTAGKEEVPEVHPEGKLNG